MLSCAVYGCANSTGTDANPAVHYYVFPKHPVIVQQWLEACGWNSEQIDINTARVCSIHFDEDSYTTEVKLIDFIACYTRVLKYDAVPTLFLPTTQIYVKHPDSNEEGVNEILVFTVPTDQENQENVAIGPSQDQDLDPFKGLAELQVQNNSTENNAEEHREGIIKVEAIVHDPKYTCVTDRRKLEAMQKENETLRTQIVETEKRVKRLKGNLCKKIQQYRELDLRLSNLHDENLRTKRSFLSLQEQKRLLAKVFSESQIKILCGRKKIYWSNDDMAVGYTIRHLSNKRCYMYLTKNLNIPLPAVSSIKRWMTLKHTQLKKAAAISASKEDEADNGKDEESLKDRFADDDSS